MQDWRTRAWFQIGLLETALGPGASSDPEVARRRDMWTAIDRFSWPQLKEPQFGQLELATRTEAELLRYIAASPPMRDAALGPGARDAAKELAEPAAGLPDWRSRALFQVRALSELLGGAGDAEVARRAGMWLAIDKFSWPQMKEQQFAQVELVTRVEAELLRYMMQSPPMKELVERHGQQDEEEGEGEAQGEGEADAPEGEGAASPKPVMTAPPDADVDPMGDIAPVERYHGPPASVLYKEGTMAWAEYAANEYKAKAKAREAARRLREVFLLLDKNPDGETQMRALEKVVGLSWQEIADNVLEKRVR